MAKRDTKVSYVPKIETVPAPAVPGFDNTQPERVMGQLNRINIEGKKVEYEDTPNPTLQERDIEPVKNKNGTIVSHGRDIKRSLNEDNSQFFNMKPQARKEVENTVSDVGTKRVDY